MEACSEIRSRTRSSIRSRILSVMVIPCAFALSACNNGVVLAPVYISVAVSPRIVSLPVGGTMVFTGTVSNNLSLPQWSVLDAAAATSSVGTLTPVSGSPNSILYTAPATPPIYGATPTGITQGWVTLNVTTTSPSGTSVPISGDSVTFTITAPTVTLSLTPVTASVALGATQQFIGYAIGNVNNTLTWQVNGVTGGSSATTGTINSAGTYIAPVNMPMGGSTVTITVISQADPIRTASAVITLH